MIEEKINGVVNRFTFNRQLPAFVDMAKYLENNLVEGESLEIVYREIGDGKEDAISVKIKGRDSLKDAYPLSLTCRGNLSYLEEPFSDYRPLPNSQRYPNN